MRGNYKSNARKVIEFIFCYTIKTQRKKTSISDGKARLAQSAKSLNVHTSRKEVRSQRITEVIQSVVAALLLFKNEASELMKQLPLRENYRVVT